MIRILRDHIRNENGSGHVAIKKRPEKCLKQVIKPYLDDIKFLVKIKQKPHAPLQMSLLCLKLNYYYYKLSITNRFDNRNNVKAFTKRRICINSIVRLFMVENMVQMIMILKLKMPFCRFYQFDTH